MNAFRLKAVAALLLVLIPSLLAVYYHHSYQDEKALAGTIMQRLKMAEETLGTIQRHQQEVTALDAKHIRELKNARLENDQLRAAVAGGERQLRIKGACNVPEAAAGPGVGDDGTIRLSKEAGSAVLDLRSGILTDQQKLKFLQEYVATQCK